MGGRPGHGLIACVLSGHGDWESLDELVLTKRCKRA